ncbi:hypothetical protein MB901379_04671 [Mycobacterium basiliense]|uniref:Uncharacterized protein n=1 Tax=Mycobacterium basiliense TaxID=2094119 RepID=A0A447GKM0_9MYCO|nr:hypothetical protein MB901379_04671 [Mycobacterium basiliense]
MRSAKGKTNIAEFFQTNAAVFLTRYARWPSAELIKCY